MKNFHLVKQGKYLIRIFNQTNPNMHFANIFIHKKYMQSYKKSYQVNIANEVIITIPKKNCFQTKSPSYFMCSVGISRNYWIRDTLNVIQEKVKGWIFLLRYKGIQNFCFEQAQLCAIEKLEGEQKLKLQQDYNTRKEIIDKEKARLLENKRKFLASKNNIKSDSENNNIPISMAYDHLSPEEIQRLSEPISEAEARASIQELLDIDLNKKEDNSNSKAFDQQETDETLKKWNAL